MPDILLTLLIVTLTVLGWALVFVSVAIHEIGHVVGALLIGWRPYLLVIGKGKERDFFRTGTLRVKFCLNPFGGKTAAVPLDLKSYRFKSLFLSFSGPAASALYGLSLLLLYRDLEDTNWAASSLTFLRMMLFWEAIVLIANVIPHDVRRLGKIYHSDAKRIFNLMVMRSDDLIMGFRQRKWGYALFCLQEGEIDSARDAIKELVVALGHTSNFEFLSTWLTLLLQDGNTKLAEKEVEQLLNDANDDERMRMLDGIASLPVFADFPDFVPLAVRCIDEAIRLDPQIITLRGTKASLLVEQGDLDAGIAMLEEVLRNSQSEIDQGICSYYLAYAASKKGETTAAIEYLRTAKGRYPGCPVAERIGRKILEPTSA